MAIEPKTKQAPTAPAEQSAGLVWTYEGPVYSQGIIIHEEPGIQQRPAQWDQARIVEFITRYPRYAKWFVQAPMTDPKETA